MPLDAVVIDIYWFGPDIQGHMGNLDWDRDAWPTPEDMIADFRRRRHQYHRRDRTVHPEHIETMAGRGR